MTSSFRSIAASHRRGLWVWFAIMATSLTPAQAQDADAKPTAAGEFITVDGPVDDELYGRITNAALSLQNIATQERRPAFLVLDLGAGASRFGQVHDLAKLFKSDRVTDVRTIAWIRGKLTGNNVILALCSREIVMSDSASIGDIGRGQPVDPSEIDSLSRLLADAPRNPLVNPAIGRSMADRSEALVQIRIRDAAGMERVDIVTQSEAARLADQDVEIQTTRIKEAGVIGVFNTRDARRLNILANHFCETRDELATIYGIELDQLNEAPPREEAARITLIRVGGTIDPILASFVDRQISSAVARKTQMIVFEIDSFGGYLAESEFLANRIAELDPSIRTVAWIPDKAISGAAIIALGCDEIYMRPNAQIGDAGPISIRPGEQFERAPEKILSKLRASMGSLAEMKGRPPALLKAMADKDLLVYAVEDPETGAVTYMSQEEIDSSAKAWRKLYVVEESKEANLLTLNGKRAHEVKLAMAPAEDFGEVRLRLGIPASMKLKPAEPTWIDTMIYVLNSSGAMFLLVVLGVIFIYLELHFMTGLMGILSVLCFTLFFWSRFLGGTAGWLEVVLFLLGLGCVAMEIFVIPGFGVFGVSGGLLLVASLVMASQTFSGVLWGQSGDLRILAGNLGTVAASVGCVVLMAAVMNRFLPSMPFLGSMILSPPGARISDDPTEPMLNPSLTRGSGDDAGLVGERGVAISILRPSGKARILGTPYDVVTEGSLIREGTEIEVVEVSGNRIVVRKTGNGLA